MKDFYPNLFIFVSIFFNVSDMCDVMSIYTITLPTILRHVTSSDFYQCAWHISRPRWNLNLHTQDFPETLSCSDVLTSLPPPLYCSRYLGPWSYLHLINWVEEEIGLWRRISNTWSSSLFFVFQMHDICKSLFLVAHVIEALLPPYTQTHCHILYHDDRNNCKGKVNDGHGYIVNNLVRAGLCYERICKERVYWSMRESRIKIRATIPCKKTRYVCPKA